MMVICSHCRKEFDWNSKDIFDIQYPNREDENIRAYICRNCMKIHTKAKPNFQEKENLFH